MARLVKRLVLVNLQLLARLVECIYQNSPIWAFFGSARGLVKKEACYIPIEYWIETDYSSPKHQGEIHNFPIQSQRTQNLYEFIALESVNP